MMTRMRAVTARAERLRVSDCGKDEDLKEGTKM